ncbi:hypothetical protein PR202_ga03766 [Eleusine coracana subsp. coracana]|uniref:Uncharacterized protein n=1 Tax=Eleusine coracana subsp. coracana TaxID=191504 RepID=A0AAV5BR92_ELECO|nr:hypothetical protein PR202_ga03766 [Eleusine coracana subsp. coracana]
MMANGRLQKQALLPPRSPFPAATAPHAELGPIARPREAHHRHGHQRTSSESFLVDEQPSWLDDLLDEPETPARAHGRPGHRRSSSDSFTLFDGSASAGMYDNASEGRRGGGQVASWTGAPEFFPDPSSFGRQQGRPWEPRQMYRQGAGVPMPGREKNAGRHGPSSSFGDHEHGPVPNGVDRKGHADTTLDQRKEGVNLRHSQSEADTKRAKHMLMIYHEFFSKALTIVYIVAIDGSSVSLEDQQEMFEREISRLRSLFQQQQPQHVAQQQAPSHSRSNSRDLDSQFANLSLKHSDPNSGRDAVTGLRI